MRLFILLVLIGVVVAIEDSSSENENLIENVIKRDSFPYMAILYYPDDTIIDVNGARVTKAAVLIRENWLLSSFFENADIPIAFPKKTLISRLGAITIDANFTLNEDENEQEREIIQIARPYNFNIAERWLADICLLKTILPFTITPTVAVITAISTARSSLIDKNCFILAYARNENKTERKLMKGVVDMLKTTEDNCGTNFKNDTMLCSVSSEEKSYIFTNPQFCEGNSGGPLICDNELTGIQTYIDDCKQPYLYQALSAWNNLLSCATAEKCMEENCATICVPIYKDAPITTTKQELTTVIAKLMLADGFDNTTIVETFVTPTLTTVEMITTESELLESTESTSTIVTKEEELENKTTILTNSVPNTSNMVEDTSTTNEEKLEVKTTVFSEEIERRSNVQAQRHRLHNKAPRNEFNIISYFVCLCLVFVRFI